MPIKLKGTQGTKIEISNNDIILDVLEGNEMVQVIHVYLSEGSSIDGIEANTVIVHGNVNGDVKATTAEISGDVKGDADITSLEVNAIHGNVKATSVDAIIIKGKVQATTVTHG